VQKIRDSVAGLSAASQITGNDKLLSYRRTSGADLNTARQLRERQVKTGAKIVRHGRSVIFQMAEVMVSRALFQQILDALAALRRLPSARC
jgi:hypothetical protein